jgi:hypothetical protein
MGAGIAARPSLKGLAARGEITQGRHRGGAENVESKIGHLPSYARIAIHIRDFSSWRAK